jgi:hypothetical protein
VVFMNRKMLRKKRVIDEIDRGQLVVRRMNERGPRPKRKRIRVRNNDAEGELNGWQSDKPTGAI